MKRKIAMMVSVILAFSCLYGCGTQLDVEESTIYLDKKGKVVSIDIEPFEKEYYDADELQEYVEKEIEAYTSENGKKTVVLEEISVDEAVANLKMKYASAEDYTKFNDIELYTGTVIKAMAEGYDFNVDFAVVEDGKIKEKADRDKVLENDDYKVAIVKANTNVVVDGEICFVSTENVEVTGKNTIKIRGNMEAEQTTEVLTYVVFK